SDKIAKQQKKSTQWKKQPRDHGRFARADRDRDLAGPSSIASRTDETDNTSGDTLTWVAASRADRRESLGTTKQTSPTNIENTESTETTPETTTIRPRIMATGAALVPFTGNLEEKRQPKEFAREVQLRFMELQIPSAEWTSKVHLYFAVDSKADKWYHETLTTEQRQGSWETFLELFKTKFPSQEVKEKPADVYLQELKNLLITADQLRLMHPDSNVPWHQHWASQLMAKARNAEVADGKAYIDVIWDSMPSVLQ
ncbi:hypothetical protein EV361DRAFT_991273, partial [Lentinula raphanica]